MRSIVFRELLRKIPLDCTLLPCAGERVERRRCAKHERAEAVAKKEEMCRELMSWPAIISASGRKRCGGGVRPSRALSCRCQRQTSWLEKQQHLESQGLKSIQQSQCRFFSFLRALSPPKLGENSRGWFLTTCFCANRTRGARWRQMKLSSCFFFCVGSQRGAVCNVCV
jgi:hypothetical protein